MRNTNVVAIALALLMIGCAQAHSPDEIATGTYELMITSELEECSPARPVGAMGTVAVVVDRGAIDAPVPDAFVSPFAAPRVRLAPEQSLHAETNRRVGDCEGAWVHEEWTVLGTSAQAFELSHLQTWQGLSGCFEPSEEMPGAPSADCTSERTLRYTIDRVCNAPCELQITAADTVGCVCP